MFTLEHIFFPYSKLALKLIIFPNCVNTEHTLHFTFFIISSSVNSTSNNWCKLNKSNTNSLSDPQKQSPKLHSSLFRFVSKFHFPTTDCLGIVSPHFCLIAVLRVIHHQNDETQTATRLSLSPEFSPFLPFHFFCFFGLPGV